MKKETKEIVALTEKWLNEIKELAVNYEKNITVLADAKRLYEGNAKKWWVIYKKVISLLVGVAFHLKLISANSQ